MEEKIIQYVNYQFRFETREDLEELKAEIIANLIDRYHEALNQGKSNEEAYVTAIKSMGNFTENKINDIPDEFSVKPSIPDILLISGAILSIFGFIITLFTAVTGALVTALSIILFSGSAYYLYSYSQYIRKEQMDIEKHNILLTKIFKYMKTSFVFWALSLSFILASLVMGYVTKLVLLDPMDISFEDIQNIIAGYTILFIIALIIFLLIFRNIYLRLMNHYYLLTGNSNLKGKIRESYEFLYRGGNVLPRKSILASNRFLPILGLIMIIPILFMPIEIWAHNAFIRQITYSSNGIFLVKIFELINTEYTLYTIITLISLALSIIMIIIFLIKKIERQWHLILSYYITLISVFILIAVVPPYAEQGLYISGEIPGNYSFFATIILTIIIIIRWSKIKRSIH